MTQLQINSPEMKDIFETRFNSNQEKFMEFVEITNPFEEVKDSVAFAKKLREESYR